MGLPSLVGLVDGGEMACSVFTRRETVQVVRHVQATSFLCVDTNHTAVGALVDRQGRIRCAIIGTTDETGKFHGTYCGLEIE